MSLITKALDLKILHLLEMELKPLDFDGFNVALNGIDYPAQRLGVFKIYINNKGKFYPFECLKVNFTRSEDLCGIGLHSYPSTLIRPKYKKSKFHNEQSVCIDIWRNEFMEAKQGENCFYILTKNWFAIIEY